MVNKHYVRLAACIHNVTEGSSLRNVWGRLLDFVFLTKDVPSLGVDAIIAFIRDELRLPIEVGRREITDCALASRKKYAVRMQEGHVREIMLEKHYRETLRHTLDIDALDKAIRAFYQHGLSQMKHHSFDPQAVEDAIYAWLGTVVIRSHREVERMLCGTTDVREARDGDSPSAMAVIPRFITWDNKAKDDVLTSVFNAGLAFATMHRKTDLIRVFRSDDHTVYLDVDSLSKVSGLKGSLERRIMETLLGKCRDMGMSLHISMFTHDAFKQQMNTLVRDIRHADRAVMETYDEDIRHLQSKRALMACAERRFHRAQSMFMVTLEEDVRHRRRIKKQAKALRKALNAGHDGPSPEKHHLWTDLMELARLNHRCRKQRPGDGRAVFLSDDGLLHDMDAGRGDDQSLIWHPARLFAVLLKQLGRMTDADRTAMIAMMKQDTLRECGGDGLGTAVKSIGRTAASMEDADASCGGVSIGFAKK